MPTFCFKKVELSAVNTAHSQISSRFAEDGWNEWAFRKSCKIGAVTITLRIGKMALLLQGPENQVGELKTRIGTAVNYTPPEKGDGGECNSRGIRSLKREMGGGGG